MKVNKELLKGSTSIMILSLLKKKDMYGYEMIKDMEMKSKGIFELKEGTLYPILHSLEQNDAIVSYWSEGDGKRKRKYYKITDGGKALLNEKESEWRLFTTTVNSVLGDGELCVQ